MYSSLKLPWSTNPTPAEAIYRDAGLVKTKGTIYLLPPSQSALRQTFNSPPRPKSRMSSGATALCKHFERGGASSEKGIAHPFWTLPVGSNDNKSAIAAGIMEGMLSAAVWRNVMMLHTGVAVYEIRNEKGYGMRWTLHVERQNQLKKTHNNDEADSFVPEQTEVHDADLQDGQEGWCIRSVGFRGFVEPIEGIGLFEQTR